MELNELLVASDLLNAAIDRYKGAFLAINRTLAGRRSRLGRRLGSRVINEIPIQATFQQKLQDIPLLAKQTFNLCPDAVPISRISRETLVQVFQLLVDTEHMWSSRAFPKYPVLLSHVSSAWRRIVYSSPPLWSRVRIFPQVRTNGHLGNYIRFCSTQARGEPMNIIIQDSFVDVDAEMPRLSEFADPFTGKMKSLEFRLFFDLQDDSDSKLAHGGSLIAKYLEASKNILKRFTLKTSAKPSRPLFLESASDDDDCNGLILDLPHEQIEDALFPIVDLRLRGAYFHWESKAYHGLVSLRLDHGENLCSISEPDLQSVIVSSPRLRWLDVRLKITKAPGSSDPLRTHLPDLECLIGDIFLLQLILPGPNQLTVSILGRSDSVPGRLFAPSVEVFFSHAHLVHFYSMQFLTYASEISRLLSLAPHLQSLALSGIKLPGVSVDMEAHNSLNTLYLLHDCELEWNLLRGMLEKCAIARLVFWGKIDVLHDNRGMNWRTLELELTSLPPGNIQLEIVPVVDRAENLFFGPAW